MDQSAHPSFSSSEAFRLGWSHVRDNVQPVVVLGALSLLLTMLQRSTNALATDSARPVFPLLVPLLQACITMLYMRWALAAQDGRAFDLGQPLKLLDGFLSFLLTGLLLAAIVCVGLMLLVIPGVLWGLKYGFAGYLVVDQQMEPLTALRESARLTHGQRLALLKFAVLAFLLNVAGALALGLGVVVTLPITFAAAAHVLRQLQHHAGARRVSTAAPTAPEASQA